MIPSPPVAYWEQIPWWAFLLCLVIVGVLASPFTVQVLRGRAGRLATREKAFTDAQDRLEKARTAHETTLFDDAASCRAQLARERAEWERERAALLLDRDDGWSAGRGMEDVARWHRHENIRRISSLMALRTMFADLAEGRMSPERAKAILPELSMPPTPPAVPLLRDVARKTSEEYEKLK